MHCRAGLSLIEILISMFVLLFGLMGVAAIFPVGSHYANRSEQFDRGAAMAQTAFEELRARGILRPDQWIYAATPNGAPTGFPTPVIRQNLSDPDYGLFSVPVQSVDAPHPGHAFVIDPMGVAAAYGASYAENPLRAQFFPYGANNGRNPWQGENIPLWGRSWPIRRISFATPIPDNSGNVQPMPTYVAESIFRLRDDVSVELPDESDRPGIQLWESTGGTPVARAYAGNYSWLATIVPTTPAAIAGLQPLDNEYGNRFYDVSVAVFRNRVAAPAVANERLLNALIFTSGEVQLFLPDSDSPSPETELDEALEGLRSGQWIALAGVNPANGAFVLKWYKLLSLDEESQRNILQNEPTSGAFIRRAMVDGPEWPMTQQQRENLGFAGNLGAIVMPGVIGVTTRPMKMEDF